MMTMIDVLIKRWIYQITIFFESNLEIHNYLLTSTYNKKKSRKYNSLKKYIL